MSNKTAEFKVETKNKTAYIRTLLQNQGIISDKSYKFAHISLEFYSPANREPFSELILSYHFNNDDII